MGILKIIRIFRQIRKGTFNPKEFAGEEGADVVTGVIWIPIIICGILTAFFLAVGFTVFWFGPVMLLGILGVFALFSMVVFIRIKNKITTAIKNQINLIQ